MAASMFKAIAAAITLLAPLAASAEPVVTLLPLPFTVAEFRAPQSFAAQVMPSLDAVRANRPARVETFALVWGEGQAAGLYLAGGEVKTLVFALPGDEESAPFGEAARDATPGTRLASAGPLTAWLASPPEPANAESPFGEVAGSRELVIGERKAGAASGGIRRVAVETTRLEAGADAVFTDVEPRFVDLDGDGAPEIVVVRQTPEGARLAVVARSGAGWAIAAETPAVGPPDSWLNPAAMADFTGRGRPDIAVIRSPHGDGVLQLWAYEGSRLVLRGEKAGYSNHALGSAALDLAAVVSLGGERTPALAVPTLDRRHLALLSLKGEIREIARVQLPSPVSRGVAVLRAGGEARILVGLEDGRIAVVKP